MAQFLWFTCFIFLVLLEKYTMAFKHVFESFERGKPLAQPGVETSSVWGLSNLPIDSLTLEVQGSELSSCELLVKTCLFFFNEGIEVVYTANWVNIYIYVT